MDRALLLIARVVLALVFLIAGGAKLADLRGTRKALREFGLPARAVAPTSIALPLAELAIGGALIATTTARAASLGAVVLLLTFALVIGRAVARGERPDCHCFGALHSAPAGWRALLRNLLLASVAVAVVAAGPGRSVSHALEGVNPWIAGGVTLLVIVLATQAWFSYHLFRQNGRLLGRIEALEGTGTGSVSGGLPPHAAAPRFELPDVTGRRRSLDELLAPGMPLALAFLDPDCGACQPLVPRLAELRAERSGELELALVTRGGASDTRQRINGHAFDAVLLQEHREIAEAYRVNGVPSAVIITPEGRIGSQMAVGQPAIEQLLSRSATRQPSARPEGAPLDA